MPIFNGCSNKECGTPTFQKVMKNKKAAAGLFRPYELWIRLTAVSISAVVLFLFPASLQSQPSQDRQIHPSLQDQVKVMRLDRYQKMPYLDRDIVRAEINPEKIKEKSEFLSGKEKHLQDLISRAVRVYTPARAARERISLARRRIIAAIRDLFPEASFEYQKKGGTLSASRFNSRNYKFSFRQPIFRGGILWNTLLQEKAGLEAAEKEYDSVIEDLMREVSNSYFEYNRALQVVNNQSQAIQNMQHFIEISKRKFSENIVSEIENLNVQSLFSQVQYDHETSKQELELAKLELQRYLDLEVDDHIVIASIYELDSLLKLQEKSSASGGDKSGDLFQEDRVVPPLADLIDVAYLNRSKLQVEAAKLESARLQERVRWGAFMPKVDAILDFGKTGEAFDSQSMEPGLRKEFRFGLEFTWNVAGNKVEYTYEHDEKPPSISQFLQGDGSSSRRNSINVGILDGLDTFASVKEAEVSRLEQVEQLEKIEKEVLQEVKEAYFDYQKARIRLTSTLQRVSYRRRLEALAKYRLQKNEIQISEYLQSGIDLLQEVATLHKALAEYFTAKAKLNHAIGKHNYFPIVRLQGVTSNG